MPSQHSAFLHGEHVVIRPVDVLKRHHANQNHAGGNRGVTDESYNYAGLVATVCDITHEMCGWVTYQLGFFGPCVDPRKQGILPGYFFEQCVQDFVYNRHDKEPVYFLDFQPASDFYAAEAVFRDGNWYAVIRTKDAGTELSATLCATKHQSEFLAKSINFVGTMRTVSGFHRRYQIDIHPTEIDAHT